MRLLTLLRPLHQRLGQGADFDRLVTEIRACYKRRRNLIKRLDRSRLLPAGSPPAVVTCDRRDYHSSVAYHRGALEEPMARVNTRVQLDERLLERVEQRASATGRNRDQIIEDALRRQFDDDDLQDVVTNVRERSDLTDEQALELAYAELEAMRAERRAAS